MLHRRYLWIGHQLYIVRVLWCLHQGLCRSCVSLARDNFWLICQICCCKDPCCTSPRADNTLPRITFSTPCLSAIYYCWKPQMWVVAVITPLFYWLNGFTLVDQGEWQDLEDLRTKLCGRDQKVGTTWMLETLPRHREPCRYFLKGNQPVRAFYQAVVAHRTSLAWTGWAQ